MRIKISGGKFSACDLNFWRQVQCVRLKIFGGKVDERLKIFGGKVSDERLKIFGGKVSDERLKIFGGKFSACGLKFLAASSVRAT